MKSQRAVLGMALVVLVFAVATSAACHAAVFQANGATTYTVPADGTPLIIQGRLEEGDIKQNDGTLCDFYIIHAVAPGTLMVQLNSTDFDPYLALIGGDHRGNNFVLDENNDGPKEERFGLNAFLEYPLTGENRLGVNVTTNSTGAGPYRLALAIRPGGDRAELFFRASHALNSGYSAYRANDLRNAERAFEESLDGYRRLFPGDHHVVATNRNNLAFVLNALDRDVDAEPLYEEALAMYKRLYPDQIHPDVAKGLNNLAGVIDDLGRSADAEQLYEEALAMYKCLYPDQDHPDVANSLNNLGSVRQALGRVADAEPLYEEALAMCRRLYPDQDHSGMARILSNLGSVRQALGHVADAEPLYEEALAMQRRLLQLDRVGDHLDITKSLSMLANLRIDLGRSAEAEPLLEESLAMRRRLFQADGVVDHPDLATSINDLAFVRGAMGRTVEAEQLFEEALAMRRHICQVDGVGDHAAIVASLKNLATVRGALGHFAEAEPLYEEALAMERRLYRTNGVVDHLDIATSLNNLAFVRGVLGHFAEAEPLYEESLAMRRRLFQADGVVDHPDLATSINDLAFVRVAMGRAVEAEPLLEDALAMNRRLFQVDGVKDHPNIAMSLHNLGIVRFTLSRRPDAEPLLEDALAMFRLVFQIDDVDEHAEIVMCLNSLAFVRHALGHPAEAEPLYEEALAMERRLYQINGVVDHPDIAVSLNNLASVRESLGRAAEAESLYEEALAMNRQLYQADGVVDHPSILNSLSNLAFLLISTNPSRAEILYTEALSMADRLRLATRGDAESRALMAEQVALPQIAHWLGRVRLTLGQPESAFAALETGRARSLMDLFELQYQGGLDAVIAKLSDEQRLRVEQARATESARRMEAIQVEAVLAASANRTDLTDEEREQLRQDAIAARTALGDAVAATNTALGRAIPATHAQDPAELRAALVPGELVLSIAWLDGDAYVIIVTHDRIDGEQVFADEPDRAERLRALGEDLDEIAISLRSRTRFEDTFFEHCATTLIPASLHEAIASAKRIIVINSGPASRIPADLLIAQVNPDAEVVQANSAAQFLDRRTVARDRQLARDSAGTTDRDTAVVLGRPQYAGTAPELPTYEMALADAEEYTRRSRSAARSLDSYRLMEAHLTDLPGTQTEAMVIAASLDAAGLTECDRRVTLLGPEASIPRLMAEVERLRPRVLHIATHGLIGSAEDPLDAALALTPGPDDHGFLTLDGLIRQWPGLLEDTDLVVLSACDTGWGATKGDAEFGLPWGFFLSGATSVVASLWQVDDVSTALLMARFHEGRLGSFEEPRTIRGRTFRPGTRMTTLDALDEAKHWLRTLTREEVGAVLAGHRGTVPEEGSEQRLVPDSPYPYEHPYYWAAFVLLGSSE